jgi:hypothetical protein
MIVVFDSLCLLISARALLVTLGVPEPALAVKPRVAHPLIAEAESWLMRRREKGKK